MAFFSIFLLGIQFRIRIALRPDSTISSDNITTMTTFSVSFSLSVHFVASHFLWKGKTNFFISFKN